MDSAARVAVVTGAAQGIGRRVAEVLAGEGYALALTDLREPAETLRAVRRHGVGQVPMARFASPDDVGAAVALLADPARSGFINGVALPVDGAGRPMPAGPRYGCANAGPDGMRRRTDTMPARRPSPGRPQLRWREISRSEAGGFRLRERERDRRTDQLEGAALGWPDR